MRQPWGRPAAQAFAAGCVVVLASACSSSTDPIEPKDPKISAATPTAVAPTLPPAAAADTPEGAIAFVEHYVELLNYAAKTGDVAPLQAASATSCAGCASYIGSFRSVYAVGGKLQGFDWTPAAFDARSEAGGFRIDTTVRSVEYSYRMSADDDFKTARAGSYPIQVLVQNAETGWGVSELTRPPELETTS